MVFATLPCHRSTPTSSRSAGQSWLRGGGLRCCRRPQQSACSCLRAAACRVGLEGLADSCCSLRSLNRFRVPAPRAIKQWLPLPNFSIFGRLGGSPGMPKNLPDAARGGGRSGKGRGRGAARGRGRSSSPGKNRGGGGPPSDKNLGKPRSGGDRGKKQPPKRPTSGGKLGKDSGKDDSGKHAAKQKLLTEMLGDDKSSAAAASGPVAPSPPER
eukprot:5209650-Alexandrium_andersonii.AAC.1